MRLLVLSALSLTLAACATTGPVEYGPADEKGFGYTEQRIEDGRFRITYQGSGGMPPAQVEDFALRRAAELTRQSGFDWFRVTGRDVYGEERGGVSVGTGVGTGSYGRRSSVGVGVGANLGRVGAQEFFTARLDVQMGSGEPPEGVDAYDAESVLNNLTGPAPYQYKED